MQSFSLSSISIDNQEIFRFSGDSDRYIFPLELADEIFCNFISRKAYRYFCSSVLTDLEEKLSSCYEERRKIEIIRCDISRYLEELLPDGKTISREQFEYKVRGFVTNFNYFVDVCCSNLVSSGKKIDKEKYLLDDAHIIKKCVKHGEVLLSREKKKNQEKIINYCASNTTRYFWFLCVAEEIFSIEGDNIDDEIKNLVASLRYQWEMGTLFCLPDGLFLSDERMEDIYEDYCGTCRKYEITPKLKKDFQGLYPKSLGHILDYRMPVEFYESVFTNLPMEEKVKIQNRSFEAYASGGPCDLLDEFSKYGNGFNDNELIYSELLRVFYHFLVNGYYPPTFDFECFFDEENEICIKEKFFKKRKGRDILEMNVGKLFDVFDYKTAFEDVFIPTQEKDLENKNSEVVDSRELFRIIERIKNLVVEYAGKEYIPSCDIARLSQAVLGIEKETKEELDKNLDKKISYESFSTKRKALIKMEEENRISFLNYKNNSSEKKEFSDSTGKEDFGDVIDDSVARICEEVPSFDDQIFDASNNEVSLKMETKIGGIREVIEKKYLLDLKQIRDFFNKNSENKELILLVRDAEKILNIASNGYQHDECLMEAFDWFEKHEPKVMDAVEYFCHLKKVPASYKVS